MIGIGGAPEQPQSCAVASGGAWTSAPTRSKFGRGADSSAASAAVRRTARRVALLVFHRAAGVLGARVVVKPKDEGPIG